MFDGRLFTINQNGTSVAVSDDNAANNRYFVSAPLICNILNGCGKYLPACIMPLIRHILTVDQLTNFVSSTDDVTLLYIYIYKYIYITYK